MSQLQNPCPPPHPHVLLLFSHTHPKAHTLNAISPQIAAEDAERRANHLAVCQEIIDLGMQLTRAAAHRALEAAEEAPPPNPTKPNPTQAQPPARPRDPNLPFTRAARIVLHAVTLSAQLAAGTFSRAATARTPAPDDATQPDPQLQHLFGAINRGLICDGLHRMTETHPDHEALYDTIEDTVEDSLAEHPEDPLPAHFARACKILGLTPDLTGFPAHLVEALISPGGPVPDD